jgi:hypothetical protein
MIESSVPNAARLALLKGEVKPSHTFRLHLVKSSAVLNVKSTTFKGVGEASGEGYKTFNLPAPVYGVTEDDEAFMDFPDEVKWPRATVSADGCVICDHSLDDLILAVVSFGSTIASTNAPFTLQPSDKLILWKQL